MPEEDEVLSGDVELPAVCSPADIHGEAIVVDSARRGRPIAWSCSLHAVLQTPYCD